MNAKYFELEGSGHLKVVDPGTLLSRWARGDGVFWIDVHEFQHEELESWLAPFEIPSFIADRCLKVGETTQIIPLPDAVYIELAAYADAGHSRIMSTGAVCLRNLLISLHTEPIHVINKAHQTGFNIIFRGSTIAHLITTLLLLKTGEASLAARSIRASLNDIDARLDHDPDSVTPDDLLDAKQAVSRLITVTEEQEECAQVLAEADTTVLDFSTLQGPVRSLTSIAGSVNRRADRLETRVADLQRRYEMSQQDRTNHRLAILTVLSAVFLPLTLLAGIWGLNFEHMPELSVPYAYFGALGLMALIGGGMAWLFHKRGWFE